MKKFFVILGVIYFFFAVSGILSGQYVVRDSRSLAMDKMEWRLYIIGLLTGIIFFYLYLKSFPEDFKRQKALAQILLPAIFIVFCYGLNMGYVRLINFLFNKGSISIKGKIVGRYTEKMRRGYNYFIDVRDTVNNVTYQLIVKEDVYYMYENSNEFNKEFKIGCLGIIYRNKR